MVAFKRPTSSGSWVSSTCSPTISPLKAAEAEVEVEEEEEVAMEVVIDRNVRINGLPVAVVEVVEVVVVVEVVEVGIRVG